VPFHVGSQDLYVDKSLKHMELSCLYLKQNVLAKDILICFECERVVEESV